MTTQNIFDLVDTWNAGATTFTAVKMNVTDTASASASLLMDLQIGSVSAFNVSKGGSLKLGLNTSGTNVAASAVTISGPQGTGTGAGGGLVFQVAPAGGSGALQNALVSFAELTSTRAFRLYNSADTTTNYERGFARWSANLFQIGTENAGSGSVRSMEIDSAYQLALYARSGAGMYFSTNGTFRWYFDGATGHLLAYADNTYDIGASSATRPRNIYAGTSITGPLRSTGTAPATATSTGTAGDIRYDSGFVYVCSATNTWVRAALSTW